MSDQMRRRTIAFWILLMLFVFHFALAAPVAVGEILEVRSNVGVLKDGIAAWEKRMDSGEDYSMGSDSYQGSDSGWTDTPGDNMEEDMELDASEKGSGDDNLIVNPDAGDDNGANDTDNYYDGDGYEAGSDVGSDDSGDVDSDTELNDVHSEHSSVENTSPSPEPEHPATPEHMTDLEKLSSDLSRLRPRNSGSGAVGTPKRELQGIGDTKAYLPGSSLPISVVRARVAAVSSVIGGGLVRSVQDLPVHGQNRKKWILDRLD